MWQALAEQISAEIQQDFHIEHKHQLATHSGNLLYQVQGGSLQFFVKLNHREVLDSFATEALTLKTISTRHCVKCPQVVCSGQTLDKAFLVPRVFTPRQRSPLRLASVGASFGFFAPSR